MKQRDIERVMAAAWATCDDPAPSIPRLRQVLHEVDPRGLYRADAPNVQRGTWSSGGPGLQNLPRAKTVNSVTPADDE